MTLATLSDVLQPARAGGYAVAGLVTLGWEDMRAYVAAAEAEHGRRRHAVARRRRLVERDVRLHVGERPRLVRRCRQRGWRGKLRQRRRRGGPRRAAVLRLHGEPVALRDGRDDVVPVAEVEPVLALLVDQLLHLAHLRGELLADDAVDRARRPLGGDGRLGPRLRVAAALEVERRELLAPAGHRHRVAFFLF